MVLLLLQQRTQWQRVMAEVHLFVHPNDRLGQGIADDDHDEKSMGLQTRVLPHSCIAQPILYLELYNISVAGINTFRCLQTGEGRSRFGSRGVGRRLAP